NRAGVAALRSQLEQRRAKAEKKLAGRVDKVKGKKTEGRLLKLATILDKTGIQDRTAVTRANAELDRLRGDLDPQRVPEDEDYLHELRIQIKKTRYLAETGYTKESDALVTELKAVQDAIGRWHDWLELVKTAEKVLSDPSTLPLLAQIRGWTASAHSAAVSA